MRVLGIDARGIDAGPGAGVAHATRELIEELERQASTVGLELRVYREKMSGWKLRRELRRDGVDHVLVPSGAVSPFIDGTIYPWVHDLAIFGHPEWFPQLIFKRFITTNLFLRGLRRARHVFTVSQNTKNDVVRIANVAGSRVTVTYQGIQGSLESAREDDRTGRKYALILGTVEPRKNISFIINLWPGIQKRFPQARLIVAGKFGWGNVDTTGAERIEQMTDVERDDLIASATMLLLPSLHEGFGRTALEAMSVGTPVIASRRGAIPEVVSDCGILLEPNDRNGWIEAIVKGFEGELNGDRGIEQSRRFSWEKTATIMLAKIVECW